MSSLDVKERFEAELEARKSLAQALFGLGILVTIYSTNENIRSTQEEQTTTRFSTAVAQFGDNQPDVQLAGIYALSAIAHESQKYHWPIVEVLSAHIRQESPVQIAGEEASNWKDRKWTPRELPSDIEAILSFVRSRDSEYGNENQRINLRRTNLFMADIHGASLRGALLGGVVLRDADLTGTDLRNAELTGADLRRAKLQAANLSDANLSTPFLFLRKLTVLQGVNQTQLESAIGDKTTRIPSGLRYPSDWK